MPSIGISLRARRFELSRYLRLATSRVEGRPFALLSQYRSGSTLLRRFLSSHPDLRCEGEIFLRFLDAWPRQVLLPHSYVRAAGAGSKTARFGSILRIDQLEKCLIPALHGSPQSFLQRLAGDGWTFVHLRRTNALLQALSNVVAHERQRWHRSVEGEPAPSRVVVDCERLIEWTIWNERILATEDEVMAPVDHVTVTYETDLGDSTRHQATADRVFRFLEVRDHPVEATLGKTGGGSLEDRVHNADEVRDAVHSAGFGHYLES